MTAPPPPWTRRAMLATALLGGIGPSRAAPASPRVASIDWGWAATALALGVIPVGVTECRLYAAWVGEPALPASTAELGLRTAPSLETLAALRPDIILCNGLDVVIRPQLERIAPTVDNQIFLPNRTPLANARLAARQLAERLGRREAADRWIADAEARFAVARARLVPHRGRSFFPVQFVDPRHLTYYGRGSLFADVLEILGLHSAFTGATSQWGHHGGDVASLAGLPPGDLLVVAPLPRGSASLLDGPSLMTSLLKAGDRRAYRLPPVWAFGDLTAAIRFAERVADALSPPGNGAAAPAGRMVRPA